MSTHEGLQRVKAREVEADNDADRPRSTTAHVKFRCYLVCALMIALGGGQPRAQQPLDGAPAARALTTPALTPTPHLPLPREPSEWWLVGVSRSSQSRGESVSKLVKGVQLETASHFDEALPLLSAAAAVSDSPLANYAAYHAAVVQLRLSQAGEARAAFAALAARQPRGYLIEAAALGEAEAAEAEGDYQAAVTIYERLSKTKTPALDAVLTRLAQTLEAAGDRSRAIEAYLRVYYEFPLSDLSALAGEQLDALQGLTPLSNAGGRYPLELGRAERLFGAHRYAQARTAFEGVKPVAASADRELIALRLAECDYYLKRYRSARDGAAPYVDHASRRAEAQFFYLTATRELGDYEEYIRLAGQLVAAFPDSSWAEETLNNLASHYILTNEDQLADATFREISARFPAGRYAERAAWKIGWGAYRNGRHDEAARLFEAAAVGFPRSDYRPSYLYWAARSREQLGDAEGAASRYALIATDYLNSYYGRLARKRLDAGGRGRAAGRHRSDVMPAAQTIQTTATAAAPALPPTEDQIRMLISLELYDDALNELTYAQRVWGDSPAIQATLGLIYSRTGDRRRGITLMKRAYPQYLAAGGEEFPVEVLKVLFPLDYWPAIRQQSLRWGLDPYLIAALIAQESTFVPDVHSHANAIGLMQLVPATGRRYARTLKIRRFTIGMLEAADTNIRLGTAYFKDLVTRFGGAHLALASYNAGEHRVARWIAERPGLEPDEFIDDIPFPETQNYVRKILGTAEDYRRLYGGPQDRAAASNARGTSGKQPSAREPASSKQTPSRPARKKPSRG